MDIVKDCEDDQESIYAHEDVFLSANLINPDHISVLDKANSDEEHDADDEVKFDKRLAESEVLVNIYINNLFTQNSYPTYFC